MEKQDLVAVRFVAHNEQYNSGEIAGFPADVAKSLVAGKKAVYLNPPAEEEKPLEPKTELVPATLEELVAEVNAAGYELEAAQKIAQDRFDGKYGDAARCLGADVEKLEEQKFVADLTAKLEPMKKAELVAYAAEHGLELKESSTKDELIAAIVAKATE